MVFFPHEIEMAKGEGEHILLVDNEINMRELLDSILSDSGFQVITTSNGREALTLYRGEIEKISLVVTDLAIPHLDGVSLAKAIWALNSNVPILFCRGAHSCQLDSDFDKKKYRFNFLNKPYTPQELLWNVYQLLHPSDDVG